MFLGGHRPSGLSLAIFDLSHDIISVFEIPDKMQIHDSLTVKFQKFAKNEFFDIEDRSRTRFGNSGENANP